MSNERSQLGMRLKPVEEIAEPELPEGYELRVFRPGDERAWIALLNRGDFERWDDTRLERMLARVQPRLPLDGIFFITHGADLAGSACMFLLEEDGDTVGELGWVVVDPAHRGRGLGVLACSAALRYARANGVSSVFLRTEDRRIDAIRIYTRLGFTPEMKDTTHPPRWAKVLPRLKS
jgi:mycothiol synthase